VGSQLSAAETMLEARSVLANLDQIEAGAAAGVESGAAPRGEHGRVEGSIETGTFRREGEFWTLSFQGTVVRLKDSKGLQDLARLLAQPGREILALDLASEGGGGAASVPVAMAAEAGLSPTQPLGALVDSQALAEYRRRLLELDGEIETAVADNDPERAGRGREEREFLLAHLQASMGLGGRSRPSLDPAERARKAVTGRLHDAISRIEAVHPALGKHLRRSIRTGTFCVYDPPARQDWRL
jgi:hypothetical protein